MIERRRERDAELAGARPTIVPMFVLLFVATVLVNSLFSLPDWVHEGADIVQTVLFAMALFAISCGIRIAKIVRAGGRAVLAGIVSWAIICTLALGIVWAHAGSLI